jgi:hypothetical protein
MVRAIYFCHVSFRHSVYTSDLVLSLLGKDHAITIIPLFLQIIRGCERVVGYVKEEDECPHVHFCR